jgi:predicted nucleic acid-binding protein
VSRLVIDASVAVKWVLPEDDAPAALRLLDEGGEFLAPELLAAEVSSAVLKKVRRGLLRAADGPGLVAALLQAPVRTVPTRDLVPAAFPLALRLGCSLYDGVYLALAVAADADLVTADGKLLRAAKTWPPLSRRVRALGTWA